MTDRREQNGHVDSGSCEMDSFEENAERSEDDNLPEGLRTSSDGHESSSLSETGHSEEPAIGPKEIENARDWIVEVVHGHASDAADRLSRAIDILLDAAARIRQ